MADWRARLEALCPAARRLLAVRLGSAERATLTAFFVAEAGTEPGDELRDYLKARLPDYMVPRRFVALDALPRTPAGKLDRAKLSRVPLASAPAASPLPLDEPGDAVEATLLGVWREVLGATRIAPGDDFFELGGDSLLCIRVLSRARKAGLELPADVFAEHPTVAAQARWLRSHAGTSGDTPAERPRAAVDLLLLPIQRWFFDHVSQHRAHWNQSVLLRCSGVEASAARAALAALSAEHDALRCRFPESAAGWTQHLLPEDDWSFVEERAPAAEAEQRARALAAELNGALNLGAGPLKAAAWVGSDEGPGWLALVFHHLLVDVTSLARLVEQFTERLDAPAAHAPGGGVAVWVEKLQHAAGSRECREGAAHWLDLARREPLLLPGDLPIAGLDNVEGEAGTLRARLPEALTSELIEQLRTVLSCSMHDVLLSTLALVLADWTGDPAPVIHLEGHGRGPLPGGADAGATVGWLTAVGPVRLAAPPSEAASEHASARTLLALRLNKEALAAAPALIEFGLLACYGEPATRRVLSAMPTPPVCFNYLGRLDTRPTGGAVVPVDYNLAPARHPRAPRAYLLEVNAWLENGALTSVWSYARGAHDAATIGRLAERFGDLLQELILAARHHEGRMLTPSDLSLANVNQDDLDALSSLLEDIDRDQ